MSVANPQLCAPNTTLQLVDWRDYFEIGTNVPAALRANLEQVLDQLSHLPEFAQLCRQAQYVYGQYASLASRGAPVGPDGRTFVQGNPPKITLAAATDSAAHMDKHQISISKARFGTAYRTHHRRVDLASLQQVVLHELTHLTDPLVALLALPHPYADGVGDYLQAHSQFANPLHPHQLAEKVTNYLEEGHAIAITNRIVARRLGEGMRASYAGTFDPASYHVNNHDTNPNHGVREWKIPELVNETQLPLARYDAGRQALLRALDALVASKPMQEGSVKLPESTAAWRARLEAALPPEAVATVDMSMGRVANNRLRQRATACAPNTLLTTVDWRDYFTFDTNSMSKKLQQSLTVALDNLAQLPEFARLCEQAKANQQRLNQLHRLRSPRLRMLPNAEAHSQPIKLRSGKDSSAYLLTSTITVSRRNGEAYASTHGEIELTSLEHVLLHELAHLADPVVLITDFPPKLRAIFEPYFPPGFFEKRAKNSPSVDNERLTEDAHTVPVTNHIIGPRFGELPRHSYHAILESAEDYFNGNTRAKQANPRWGRSQWRTHKHVNTAQLPLYRHDSMRTMLTRTVDAMLHAWEADMPPQTTSPIYAGRYGFGSLSRTEDVWNQPTDAVLRAVKDNMQPELITAALETQHMALGRHTEALDATRTQVALARRKRGGI